MEDWNMGGDRTVTVNLSERTLDLAWHALMAYKRDVDRYGGTPRAKAIAAGMARKAAEEITNARYAEGAGL